MYFVQLYFLTFSCIQVRSSILLTALRGSSRVSVPISTIVIVHVLLSHSLVCASLARIQIPVLLLIPPQRGSTTSFGVCRVLNSTARDMKSLKVGFKGCITPVSFRLAAIGCPAITIPQAGFDLQWSWGVGDSDALFVLEYSDRRAIHVESVTPKCRDI